MNKREVPKNIKQMATAPFVFIIDPGLVAIFASSGSKKYKINFLIKIFITAV